MDIEANTDYFEDKKSIREFIRLKELRKIVSICTSQLTIPLYLVFWILDIFVYPQYIWEFLCLRLSVIPFVLLSKHLVEKSVTHNKCQLYFSIYTLANSLPITIMCAMAEGVSSIYFVGLILVCFAVIAFIPWSRSFLVLNSCIIFIPYFVIVPFTNSGENWSTDMIANTFFIISSIIISLVLKWFANGLRDKQIEADCRLIDEIARREQIIRLKTAENTRVKLLSKQFSPQVVQELEKNNDLYDKTLKSNVCAILIDIANSTERFMTLNTKDLEKVVSNFIEDVSKTLLKYDVTIDKFQGDSILAFSNAPIPRVDYVERTLQAALEIKERLYKNQHKYVPIWNGPLEVHIAISVGTAEVGFFGTSDSFKSYTAIGPVINLVHRVCGNFGPGKIIVTQDVLNSLPQNKYQISQAIYTNNLKGIHNQVVCYEIFELNSINNENLEEVEKCPKCSQILHLDQNEKGLYILVCRSCSYSPDDKGGDSENKGDDLEKSFLDSLKSFEF